MAKTRRDGPQPPSGPLHGTQEEKIIKFLQTFNVTFREGIARQSKPSNFYLVTGEPASNDEQLNEKLTAHMKTMTFQTGFHQLSSPTRYFSCHICKMEDHQHITCDFLKLEDWTGPTNQKPWAKQAADEEDGFKRVQKTRGGQRPRRTKRSAQFRGRR